jgi:hypothetical protein
MIRAIVLALTLSSCGGEPVTADVNHPLAAEEIHIPRTYPEVRVVVAKFAEQNHFAVLPLVSQPQGLVVFSMRLFRDDVSVLVTQLKGGPIQVTAYPLCACELEKRAGLQSAANSAVNDLTRRLSK